MTLTVPPTHPTGRRRLGSWLMAPVLWLLGSTFTHGTIALLLLVRGSASAALGENGVRGAGDTGDDISVLGVEGNEIAPPAPVEPAPPPPITPPPKTPPAEVAPPPPEPPDPEGNLPPPIDEPPPRPVVPRAAGGAEANGGHAAGPVRVGSGLSDGPNGESIEGQRALLPRAVSCKDPVEGIWESLKFNPASGTWVRFTLLVHRAAGGTLTGSILSHTWYGHALDYTPPPCSPLGFEISVSMVAHGQVDRVTHIRFGASSYSVTAIQCPTAHANYAPDNFSGVIDTNRQEFQSVNNDGAMDIDVPYVFRRTSCLD